MEDLTPFPLIPTSTGQFKTSLAYRASVRAARTTKRNLKKTKPKKEKKESILFKYIRSPRENLLWEIQCLKNSLIEIMERMFCSYKSVKLEISNAVCNSTGLYAHRWEEEIGRSQREFESSWIISSKSVKDSVFKKKKKEFPPSAEAQVHPRFSFPSVIQEGTAASA